MTPLLLVEAILQQTMVFVAQVATAGGVRAPLAHTADAVFLELTRELQNQGVTKKLIADMFGMTLRTYHRRIRELSQSKTEAGRTVWEAVLEFVRAHEPVGAIRVRERFRHDDPEVVVGVLNDLVNTGLCSRAGRGDDAVYRFANEADISGEGSNRTASANEHWVRLAVYRNGPVSSVELEELTRLDAVTIEKALSVLVEDGRVEREKGRADNLPLFTSERFDVPFGEAQGWEAAVLDHYQALVAGVCIKLRSGSRRSELGDKVGGGTYSFDVGPGHPLREEVEGMLGEVRDRAIELRARVDEYNRRAPHQQEFEPVVFYMGQYVKGEE